MLYRIICFLLVALVGTSTSVSAVDTASKFLEEMRDRGMYDLALDYLEFAKTDRLVSAEFKKQIPYERGATMLAQWEKSPTIDEQKRLAVAARRELTGYAEANPGTPESAKALQKVAGLLTVSAIRALTVLEARPTPPADAEEIKTKARADLVEARSFLKKVEESLGAQLKKFPKAIDPKETAKIELRREMRQQLARVRTLVSENLLQQTRTLAEDDKKFKELLTKAAEEFQVLYDKYDGFPDGFVARLNQGECYLKLGDKKKANGCLEDIIIRCGDISGYRPLVTKAMALQAELLMEEKKYDELLEKQGKWLKTARGNELRRPEFIDLKYQVAEAKRMKLGDDSVKDAQKRKLKTEARDLYTDLSQIPNKYQLTARQILAEEFPADDEEAGRKKVKTFGDALQAAKDSIQMMSIAEQTLPTARENNPDGVDALEAQVEKGFEDALYYLDAAQKLVDDDTTTAEINEGRWLSCYLLYTDEQFYQTSVMAGFLAQRYPEDPKANMAAKLALGSTQRLYTEAAKTGEPGAGLAEAYRLKDIAGFITRRWSGTDLANDAFSVLLAFSIKDQEFDVALDLLQELSEDQKAVYQAKIANAMWELQLRASINKDESVDRASIKSKAIQLLEGSFNTLKNDPSAKDTLAAASLYLSQARLQEGKYQEALKMLEDPKSGPIALSKTDNRIASRQAYAMEAYKAALRSYISVVPPQADKAQETMAALEEIAGGGGEKLTRTYLGLGIQLKQQIRDLQEGGKAEEAKRVSEAFVTFLDRIAERGTEDPVIRRWIAQTYYQLAQGLEGDPNAADVRAKDYGKAAVAFKAFLDSPNNGLEGNQLLGMQMQYADSLRHSKEYKQAMDEFVKVLTVNAMMLGAQKNAAFTLQEWGADGDPTKFKEARLGSGPLNNGKPVIWGWNYMSKVAASVAKKAPPGSEKETQFKDLFYESYLNMAHSRLLESETKSGAEKTKLRKSARKTIVGMITTYPGILTSSVRDDYDDVLKEIQRAENAPAEGLKELEKN